MYWESSYNWLITAVVVFTASDCIGSWVLIFWLSNLSFGTINEYRWLAIGCSRKPNCRIIVFVIICNVQPRFVGHVHDTIARILIYVRYCQVYTKIIFVSIWTMDFTIPEISITCCITPVKTTARNLPKMTATRHSIQNKQTNKQPNKYDVCCCWQTAYVL